MSARHSECVKSPEEDTVVGQPVARQVLPEPCRVQTHHTWNSAQCRVPVNLLSHFIAAFPGQV